MSTQISTGSAAEAKQALLRKLLARRTAETTAAVRVIPDHEPVPASFAQKRMWFLDELAGAGATYNVPMVLRLTGPVSTTGVEHALRAVFRRHDALRTKFVRAEDGTVLQQSHSAEDLPFEVVDLTADGDADGEILAFAANPFTLAGGPLVRVKVFRLAADEYLLALNVHHIISDAWSEATLLDEFAAHYAALACGVPAALPEVWYQYRDYTAWEYAFAAGGGFEKGLKYWADQLAGALPLLELPHDLPRPSQPSGRGCTIGFDLEPDVGAGLAEHRRKGKASGFVWALAALAVTLHRLTGESDLVIGVPVANRTRPEWDRTYGLFMNTVAVRARLGGTMRLEEVVDAVQRTYLAALDQRLVPFDLVANRVAAGRDLAFTPVFQIMCNMLQPEAEPVLPGITIERVPVEIPTSKFDLTMHIQTDGDDVMTGGRAEYTTDLFTGREIGDFIGHYQTVLALFAANQQLSVAEVVLRAGTEAELFDEYLHPVPPGVIGEICTGQPMPRTGRLGRRRADGRLEEIGEASRTMVLDGLRTQPEAIEVALRRLPGVRAAVVVLRESLVGFYVADRTVDGSELAGTLLRQRIPRRLVRLDALPRLANGETDLVLLSTMDIRNDDTELEWTDTERRLARLWQELLERPVVSRHDNFFGCGGHSMLAIRLVARARNEFDQHLPLSHVFEHPVLAEMAAALDRAADRDNRVTPRRTDAAVPLSHNQEHLWFMNQLYSSSAHYNLSYSWELAGALNLDALRSTFAALAARHESLRTAIVVTGLAPEQIIGESQTLDYEIVDLGGREAAVAAAQAALAEPFDLSTGPLLRARVFRFSPNRFLLAVAVHHIVFDEWSAGVLWRDLNELYASAIDGRVAELPPLTVQYPDYAVWQRDQAEDWSRQLRYWTARLDGASTALELPTDQPRPAVRSVAGAVATRVIPTELLGRVRALSEEESVTLYTTLLSVFIVLMRRYSGQPDLLVGTPVTNRNRAELEDQIGYFVNMIVLRAQIDDDQPFRDLLRSVHHQLLDSHPHRGVPFAKVVEHLAPERMASHAPLVQVVFNMHYGNDTTLGLSGITAHSITDSDCSLDFDLQLAIRAADDGLHASLEYRTDIFGEATMHRLLGHFHTLMAGFAARPDQGVLTADLTGPQERAQLLQTANGQYCKPESASAVHELFERQAQRTPDAIALTHLDNQISYSYLNQAANTVAAGLRAHGVGPGTIVGLYLDRSPALFTALLAVLKAGGAYLPLDTSYPGQRLQFMLTVADAGIVLADSASATAARSLAGDRVRLVEDLMTAQAQSVGPAARPDNLAYVLYTSGSTGQPKGVGMSHRALLNLMRWDRDEAPVRAGGAVLQFNSLSFDMSFVEMFAAWQVGARLVVLPDDDARRDAATVLDHLERGAVERWDTPYVGLMNVIAWSKTSRTDPLLRLRVVIVGGEQLQVTDDVRAWFRRIPGCALANHYGPSEVSRATGLRLSDAAIDNWPALPSIGRSAYNTQTYILDPYGQPVPDGVTGEIHVAGANLASGYVNQPGLTAERFIPDPFATTPGMRMYATGDFARYVGAHIEFLGRADSQVKLRGHRIELGEIEVALQRLPGIRDAAVAAHGTGASRYLTGYVVVNESDRVPAFSELIAALGEVLPEYMVPSRFMILDVLPQTPSGKLYRARLPEPADGDGGIRAYVAPADARSVIVCAVWADLMGVERVGIADDFYELGGHSLLATQIVARMQSELGISIRVSELLNNPTVERFCAALDLPRPRAEDMTRPIARRNRIRTR
jgi:amino acid adenylation domain-containing protein